MYRVLTTGITIALLAMPVAGNAAAHPTSPTPTFRVTATMVPGSEIAPGSHSFGGYWMVDHVRPANCKPPVTKIKDTGQLASCCAMQRIACHEVSRSVQHSNAEVSQA